MVDTPAIRLVDLQTGELLTVDGLQELEASQFMAMDYYRRGLNVIPLPRKWEVEAWAAAKPGERDPMSKPPFLLRPFYTSRLHLCGPRCKPNCVPEQSRFESLFERTNVGVMVGRTSGNLAAFDCDSKTAFRKVGAEFDKRGIPYWSFTGARGGCYLVRIVEGEISNLRNNETPIPMLEVWGNLHYITVPPSVHPTGIIYQWQTPEPYFHLPFAEPPPAVSVESLAFLNVSLKKTERQKWDAPELYGLPEWAGLLSRENRVFLYEGATEGQRNYWLTRAAYDMAGNHIAYSEAEAALLEAAERCNPSYPAHDAKTILKSAYRKPRQPARKSGKHALKPWQKAKSFAETYNWQQFGRRAQSSRAVFMACIERARMDDSHTFRASIREVSEISNRDTKTVQKTIPLLIEAGLLQKSGMSEIGQAQLFTLGGVVLSADQNKNATNSHTIYTLAVCSVGISSPQNTIDSDVNTALAVSSVRISSPYNAIPTTPAEKDVFGKLGNVAWFVWLHLLQKSEHSGAAIARETGLVGGSVRKALKVLQKHKLVKRNTAEGLYEGVAMTDEQLERLSAQLYTLGRSEKRVRKHQFERERRINFLLTRERERWHERFMNYRFGGARHNEPE